MPREEAGTDSGKVEAKRGARAWLLAHVKAVRRPLFLPVTTINKGQQASLLSWLEALVLCRAPASLSLSGKVREHVCRAGQQAASCLTCGEVGSAHLRAAPPPGPPSPALHMPQVMARAS